MYLYAKKIHNTASISPARLGLDLDKTRRAKSWKVLLPAILLILSNMYDTIE